MLTAHPAHISVIGFNHLSRASLLGFPVVPTLNLVTDANGNLVTGDGLYREYNSLNQLLNIRNGSDSSAPLLQQFVYNPIEERVDIKKTFNNSGTVVETVYYWSKSFVTVENLTGQYNFTFVYHEGQLIAQEVQGTKLFIHGDVEGSSSVITNSTGQVVERTEYDAYGNIISGGTKTRFGYENKEADSVVGDTDFNFRKYKSEWGLFLQPDTLIPNVYDPQSLNRYMFESGNPYGYTDPDGHAAIWIHYSETKENYIAAGFSEADASKIASGAIEPDLYRYAAQGGKEGFAAKLAAKYFDLDLEMEVMGAEAEYYYHEYDQRYETTENHIQRLLADYQKAVEEGDLERMGNIEHALGHDIGSTKTAGYHAGAAAYNKITTSGGIRIFHHLNDIFGFTVNKNELRSVQIDRAAKAGEVIYERQAGQTAALRRHHAKRKG